ncbi:MAG: methyltransferase domain-containing protein [Chlamydiota bacterium]
MIRFSDIRCPTKLKKIYKTWKGKEFSILDVGCGKEFVQDVKKWFPKAKYYGLDKEKGFYDSTKMDGFFHVDLEKNDLKSLENSTFDVIICSHVIEHLSNGLLFLEKLIQDHLKSGGTIYVEFPSVHSLSLWSAKGTLQFCDDPTHIRVYDTKEIANLFLQNHIKVLRSGKARDWLRMVLFPLTIPIQMYSLFKTGQMRISFGLWDITGFAEYVYGKKCE